MPKVIIDITPVGDQGVILNISEEGVTESKSPAVAHAANWFALGYDLYTEYYGTVAFHQQPSEEDIAVLTRLTTAPAEQQEQSAPAEGESQPTQ